MLNNYSDEAIKRINLILGNGHRTKPYDLSKISDLEQALLTTVAAYRDYYHYRCSLGGLEESFDESLEYCETAAWLDLERVPERVDDLIVDGFASLNAAWDAFGRLVERAKENCIKVIKAVLSAPSATQKAVFGCEYKINPQEVDARIDELFTMLDKAEYHQSMPDNLETFLSIMEEQWKAYL